MKRLGKVLAVMAAIAVLTGIGVTSASAQGQEKVSICHRTNAPNNAYRPITVAVSAVDGVGGNDHFGQHQGPLVQSVAEAQALKAQGTKWGDIIPPVEGVHGGLNWPAGQAILENNCRFVAPEEPPKEEPPKEEPPVKKVDEREVEKVDEREVVTEVQPEVVVEAEVAVPVAVQPAVTG